MKRLLPWLVVVPSLLPSPLLAQEERSLEAAFLANLPELEPRVALHDHGNDPAFGSYGTWAAGPGYKASFHDGFTFFPRVGRNVPHNLPWQWRTASMHIGERGLSVDANERTYTQWRWEGRYAEVTEAYDIRTDGVEQTFVLRERPELFGDWVVRGSVSTTLHAEPAADRVGELVFHDAEGLPRVRYGRAQAIDARGDVRPVTTSWDGETITLTVDGAWLAEARFPVILDPLTSPMTVDTDGTSTLVSGIDVAFEPESPDHNLMIVFSRYFSGGDIDAYGVLVNRDFTQPSIVFSDLSSGLASTRPRVAYVGGADRWVIGFERSPSSNSITQVRTWVHRRGNTSTSAGGLAYLALSALGTTDRRPDVGGVDTLAAGSRALIVYQTDVTSNNQNTAYTETRGVLLDATSRSFGTSFVLSSNGPVQSSFDREEPTVQQSSMDANDPWVVVWQERHQTLPSPGPWRLVAQAIDATGTPGARSHVTPASETLHCMRPRVDGRRGRHLVLYQKTSQPEFGQPNPSGNQLWVTRFDAVGSGFAIRRERRIAAGRPFSNDGFSDLEVSFLERTQSHWAVCYGEFEFSSSYRATGVVKRLGSTGGTVESLTYGTSTTPGASFPGAVHDLRDDFVLVHAVPDAARSVVARTLVHDNDAVNVYYGTACGARIAAHPPYAGWDRFQVSLGRAQPHTVALLMLSAAPANLDLSAQGMPGCTWLVDPSSLFVFPAQTDGSGSANVVTPLPDDPLFVGDLYFQWAYAHPGANAAGFLATRGVRCQVRP